jgi:hypothetical protein
MMKRRFWQPCSPLRWAPSPRRRQPPVDVFVQVAPAGAAL